MSQQLPIYDVTGAPIVPHCLFVYAASIGSSVRLYWGRVEKVSSKGTISFQGIERWGRNGQKELRDRLTSLHSPENVVVISWSQPLPGDIRQLLDPDGVHAAALNQPPPRATGGLVG